MRYMGSKARYAKYFVPFIMKGHDDSKPYVEPFMGGGNMLSQVPASIKWGNDKNKWAVALLEALSHGYEPPESLSELDYYQIKEDVDGYPPELVGFAAFCCSYAGKEWGGFARGSNTLGVPRNFASEQVRNLKKQKSGLLGCKFTSKDYKELEIPDGSTVYCDPPYQGTTGYNSKVDHDEFWDWCSGLVLKGCRVFVSEYEAPSGWEEVWSKPVTSSLTKDTGSKVTTEKLFYKELHDE